MNSHLHWVPHVPPDWCVKPLRALCDYVVSNVDKVPVDGEQVVRLCNYSDVYNNEFITPQLEFMVSTATVDEVRKFCLLVDDVIITKDSESWDDIGVPAIVVETADDLVCGYHLALLRSRAASLSGRFLFRCLQAKVLRLQLELAANGVTRFGLSKSDIGSMRLPVPPLATQVAIAKYLDRETARLDALLAAKQRLLDLLAEKRKAIIATAVTRGLDSKAKMRNSVVPWLGEIPSHWCLAPLRWYFRIGSGEFIATDEVASEPDSTHPIPVIGGNGVAGYATSANTVDRQSIVVGRVGAQCGNVHIVKGAAWVTDNALLLREIREYDVEYLALVLRQRDLNSIANKTAQPLITGSMVTELRGPLPPMDEQRAIVEHIACETTKLDAVRAATERTIALLKERRAALIVAAVTGQVNVEVLV